MKSSELIKLTNVKDGEVFECIPNKEFIAPKGVFKLWGDARIVDNDNQTVCHLRVLDFKDGAELPSILFPPKVKKVIKPKEAENDSL